MSLINVILALFSDDPNPITNPIIQCTNFGINDKQNNMASILIQRHGSEYAILGQILATKQNMQDFFERFIIQH